MLTAVFAAGCYEALRRHSDKVTLDHLFLAVLKQEGGHAAYILKKLLRDWEIEQIRIRIERELGPLQMDDAPSNTLQTYRFDGTELLEKIRQFSTEKSDTYLNTGHLLQAIVNDPTSISTKVLALYNITASTVSPLLDDMPPNEDYYEEMNMLAARDEISEPDDASHPERLMSGIMRIAITDGKQKKEELLSRFGIDLTRAAADGELDPIVGREAEIDALLSVGTYGAATRTIALDKFREGEALAERRELIYRNWETLRERILHQLYPLEELTRRLTAAGCPVKPADIQLGREQFLHGIRTAQLIRKRYTVLDLVYELGLLKELLQRILPVMNV